MNVTAQECFKAGYAGHYLTDERGRAQARYVDLDTAMDECLRRNLASGNTLGLSVTTVAGQMTVVVASSSHEGLRDGD